MCLRCRARRDQGHVWVEQPDTYKWYECDRCGARQGYRTPQAETPQEEIPDDEKHGGGGGKIW